MRHVMFVVLTTLVSIPLGAAVGHLIVRDAHDEPISQELDCLAQDVADAEPEGVDDAMMKQHVAREGGQLVERKAAAGFDALIKQLALEQCELDLPDAASPSADGESLYQRASESVVVISAIYKCDRCDNWHATCASGFVITSSGAVVTNYHVVDQAEKAGLVAMTSDGRVMPVTRVLAANELDDVAILQVEGKDLKPLPIAHSATAVGTPIAVISHPDHRFYTYTSGVVSRYHKVRNEGKVSEAMTITADFARGSSGAPVLNEKGEVVGVVRSTRSIYYHVEKGQQKNLQMVFKTCAPSESLLRLIAGESNQG